MHLAKYIIIQHEGQEYPILFPITLKHSDMLPAGRTPVAAGFYQILDAETLHVGGMSTSLNLAPREKDASLIRNLLTATPV